MLPVIQIGPLAIQTPGLILLVGLWVGLNLSERYASRLNLDTETFSNLALYAILAGAIGARLGYVVRFPSAFAQNPASIISINPGLLDSWGALLGVVLMTLIYGQRKGLALWPTLDAATPMFAALAIAIPLSHLASGQGFGLASEVPWAIELWGKARHPSQAYETLAAGAILLYLLRLKVENNGSSGLFFLEFVVLSFAAQLLLEAFRADSILLPNGWRQAQVLAWLALAASLWLFARRRQAGT